MHQIFSTNCLQLLLLWQCGFAFLLLANAFELCTRLSTLKCPSADTEIIKGPLSACAQVTKVIAFLTTKGSYGEIHAYVGMPALQCRHSCRNLKEKNLFYYSSELALAESAIIANKYAIYRYIDIYMCINVVLVICQKTVYCFSRFYCLRQT